MVISARTRSKSMPGTMVPRLILGGFLVETEEGPFRSHIYIGNGERSFSHSANTLPARG